MLPDGYALALSFCSFLPGCVCWLPESCEACAGAKLQGKPGSGSDRAGLAQTQRKPAAAPTSQVPSLKKQRISCNLPQAASPAAAAAGQPHATSARPPATKPSHKRKVQADDAAAAAGTAHVGGSSPPIPQQQQQKRRKPMPNGNQPTAPGSKLKSTVPPGAPLHAVKVGSPRQHPAKHDAQALPRPKAQQKLPAEPVSRGEAASSHAERPPVVAQEMVATSDPHIADLPADASGQGLGPGKPTSPFQKVPAGSPSGQQKGLPTKQPPVSPFQEPANDSQRPSAGLDPHGTRPPGKSQHADAQQEQSTELHPHAQQCLARSSERGEPGAVKDKAHASSRGLDGIPADLFTSSGRGQRQPLGVIDMVLFDSCRWVVMTGRHKCLWCYSVRRASS